MESRRIIRKLSIGLLLALVGTLSAAPAAQALTLVTSDGAPVPERLTNWAEKSKAPAPSGTVTLRLDGEGCPATACAAPAPATIWLTPAAGRAEFLHELGHHFDYSMSEATRSSFQRIMHMEGRPWRDAPDSPHEQFAEAYRMCAQSPARPDTTRWGFSYRPSVAQHRRVCALVRRAAASAPAPAAARASTHTHSHSHSLPTPLDIH